MKQIIKHKETVGLLIGVVALALVAATAVYATAGGGDKPGKCDRYGRGWMSVMKDAETEVTNTSKGVVIIITSEKPEVVKAIQTRFANFGKHHQGASGHAEGSEECKKAHESGKCKGHEPGSHEQPK